MATATFAHGFKGVPWPHRVLPDQKSLNSLLSQTIQTPKQQKWTTKLQGYDLEIIYRPGKQNDTNQVAMKMTKEAKDKAHGE